MTDGFIAAEIGSTVRFFRGYRYLDTCGDMLIRLEETLGEDWLTGEISVKNGTLKSQSHGMVISFNSEYVTVRQTELVVQEAFSDIASKAYEIVTGTLGIERVISPSLQIVFRKRAESLDDADAQLLRLNLAHPSDKLCTALKGSPTLQHLTMIRESSEVWQEIPVNRRLRLQASATGTLRQPPFDERLTKRVRTLPSRQNDALKQLLAAREKFVGSDVYSAQLDLELSFEGEYDYRGFGYRDFLTHGWEELHRSRDTLVRP